MHRFLSRGMLCLVMARILISILISRKSAAVLLGISIGTLDMLVRKGTLEPVRLGKRVMFNRQDIETLALPPSRRRVFDSLNLEAPVQ